MPDLDRSDERGAVVVLVAAAMGGLLMMVALLLDMGGARRDRDADQVAADVMALAAAANLGGPADGAAAACDAAWDYLEVNLGTSLQAADSSSPCDTFDHPCPVSGEPVDAEPIELGEYTVTFTHPVPEGHQLLTSQPAGPLDGKPCDRFGIRVQQDRPNLWAAGSVELDVHAVGRYLAGVGTVPAPLVLLEPSACSVLTVSGTSVLEVEGAIAIDSDGSQCSSGNNSVIFDVNGTGTVKSDVVSLWALHSQSADSVIDVNRKATLTAVPQAASAPVGTNAVRWRYDCDPDLGCPGAGPPHITELEAALGGQGEPLPPGTWTRWTQAYGPSCSTGAALVPAGSWYIDCPGGLVVNGTLSFAGGDVVADAPFSVTGSGALRINCSATANVPCPMNPNQPSILYLRSGSLVHNNDLVMLETFVYLQDGSFSTAGNGRLTWTAPDDPAHPFDDLLLWTEHPAAMSVTGTADLSMEGIFYAPRARLTLRGSTGTEALGAQMFASALDLAGGASFHLAPDEDRVLKIGRGRVILIR